MGGDLLHFGAAVREVFMLTVALAWTVARAHRLLA
jgi:hypothetical protein